MTKDTSVTILIPSWDNFEYLQGALLSLLGNQTTSGLMRVIVINNGHKNSCDWIDHPLVTVVQTGGKNLGWEGGITEGLKHTTSPFVVFFNDDAYIPPSSKLWVNQLLQHFKHPKVGAVGPASNVVMGNQNIFVQMQPHIFTAKFLIGFCVMVRREAWDKIGGMDMELAGGDDLDWSIRLRDAGYELLVDRTVFVYHHGFKTGTRIMGDHQTAGGWNSYEMQERTNTALIKKHGLKKWYETIKNASEVPQLDFGTQQDDIEGEKIRALITNKDKTIYDLGCGGKKTLERAIGIDYIAEGEEIPTLEFATKVLSQADIRADVSKELPVEDKSADVLLGRHCFEHMLDPITTLGLWLKKLKSGGRLILALPNQDWISTIPMNSEHVHAYTPQSAGVLFDAFGMKNVQVYASGNNVSFIITGEKP